MRRNSAKKEAAQNAKRKGRVTKFRPETAAARDEGPRLIPLPDNAGPLEPATRNNGSLPTNRYVALADIALRLWSGGKTQPAETSPKVDAIPSRRPKR